jgi:hypothetical protein
MSLLAIQDAIVTKLKELAQDVYDDGVPEETKLRFSTDGIMLPYIIVEHAGVVPSPNGSPIAGVAGASGKSSTTILCIGPNQRSSRQVAGLVRQKLTGFKVATSGELTPSLAPYTYIDGNARPIRYVTEITFDFITDTVW